MKRLWICAAAVILTIGLLCGCEKEEVNYIKTGTELLTERKYAEAIEAFEQSLEMEEDIAEANRGLGIAYYNQQNYAEAREAFRQVLENGGEATPVLYNFIGVCSMHLDDDDGAIEAFEQGISLEEEQEEIEEEEYTETIREMRYNLIACYENKRDWANAKARMEEYSSLYPEDKTVWKEAEFLRTR